MRNIVFILLFFLFVKNTYGHNPNTASVVFQPINGIWTIHLSISQQGADYALIKYYSDLDLKRLDLTEYKKLYIDYIKEKISLNVDGNNVDLTSGGIKLGDHQTDIRFLLPDLPKDFIDISGDVSIFNENKGQYTVVRFLDNDKSFREVMSHKNGFKFDFKNTDTAFISIETEDAEKNIQQIHYGYYVVGFSIVLILGLFFWRIKKHRISLK